MDLNKYIDEKDLEFQLEQRKTCTIIMNYLKRVIKNKNLSNQITSNDPVIQYEELNGWLFEFYEKEFLEALEVAGVSIEEYYRKRISNFMLTAVKKKKNTNYIFDSLESKEIIDDLSIYNDKHMELITKEYGTIPFGRVLDIFKDDKEFVAEVKKYGKDAYTLCHELTYYALQRYPDEFRAVTAICKNSNNLRYYHSFIIDNNDYVMDIANNIYMPKEYFYLLDVEEELNVVTLEEAEKENLKTEKYDSSTKLCDLLRNALYKEYKSKAQKKKIIKK